MHQYNLSKNLPFLVKQQQNTALRLVYWSTILCCFVDI